MLDPEREPETPFITQQMAGAEGPIIATTDFMAAIPDQIRQFVPNEFATLGADSYGISDTRAAARRLFRIDAHSMVVRALQMLGKDKEADQAIEKYDLTNVNAGTSGTPDEE